MKINILILLKVEKRWLENYIYRRRTTRRYLYGCDASQQMKFKAFAIGLGTHSVDRETWKGTTGWPGLVLWEN